MSSFKPKPLRYDETRTVTSGLEPRASSWTWSFLPALTYPTGDGPIAVGLADFDGDGRLDVATVNTSSASLSILFGQGDGTLWTGGSP